MPFIYALRWLMHITFRRPGPQPIPPDIGALTAEIKHMISSGASTSNSSGSSVPHATATTASPGGWDAAAEAAFHGPVGSASGSSSSAAAAQRMCSHPGPTSSSLAGRAGPLSAAGLAAATDKGGPGDTAGSCMPLAVPSMQHSPCISTAAEGEAAMTGAGPAPELAAPANAQASASPGSTFCLLNLPDDVLHRLLQQLLRPAPPATGSNTSTSASASSSPISTTTTTTTMTATNPAPDPLQLRRAARLASTCRRLRQHYRSLLAARPLAALQVEAERASVKAKRRLVRRLTLDQHSSYMRQEVAAEFGFGSAGLLLLSCICSLGPSICMLLDSALNFAAFTFIHILIHTAIQAAAYRTCATVGTRYAVLLGLATIGIYYCAATAALQCLLGIPDLPPHLDLQPWGRRSSPLYPAAMAIWPFFGTRTSWRVIHVLSNSFAWCYGVVGWNREYSYVKIRNGIRA